MINKMSGKIKWYKPQKGYGYILGYDEETYFFRDINCIDVKETFEENDEVLFEAVEKEDILYACKVEKVK